MKKIASAWVGTAHLARVAQKLTLCATLKRPCVKRQLNLSKRLDHLALLKVSSKSTLMMSAAVVPSTTLTRGSAMLNFLLELNVSTTSSYVKFGN